MDGFQDRTVPTKENSSFRNARFIRIGQYGFLLLKRDFTNPFQPTPPNFLLHSTCADDRPTSPNGRPKPWPHTGIEARSHVPRVEGPIRLQGYSTTLLKEPLRAPVRSLASERDREVRTPASVVTLGDTGSAAIFKKERSRGIEIAKVG